MFNINQEVLNILLIEDNVADATYIKNLLSNVDSRTFNVNWCKRLQKGLYALESQNFDVILLDLSLPDSFGIETISDTIEMAQTIPVIVLTGEDDDSLAVRAVQQGAQDYLIKAKVDYVGLLHSIKYAIERKRLGEALKESEEKLKVLNEELEQKVRERTFDLGKRVKEVTCLYDISKIVGQSNNTMEEIFIKIVDRIPISMQYPKIACSRLISDGKEYRSKKFLESKWKLSSDILINSHKTGSVEIVYLDDPPTNFEEPFLKEEKDLINAIAEILSGFIERKQTEKAKRQAHVELEAIFNTAGGGMRVIDKDFNVLKINTPFGELAGLSKEEFTDQKCFEQFPGPHCNTSECTMNRILNGEERVDNEVIKTRRDGSKIPTMVIATSLKNEDGELIGLVEDFKDMTERIQAEESSKQASAEFATIFNAAGDGMRVVGTDYSVLRANKAFAEIVGLNETELIEQKCDEQFWHEYCSTPLCTLQRIINGVEFIEMEAVKQRSDGTNVFVIITATPFRNADGEISGVVEVFKDITLRKQTEENLRESEEKYRLLVKSSPYSIILLDINGSISDCNQITEKYLALSRDEIVGKTIDDINLISEKDKQLILNSVQELIDIKITEPKEFEFINESRERIWLENIFSYVKIGGNDYIQILSSDITERKKIESIIQQELEKLKELDKLKSEFVLRASHELKTPLNSVYSASTILLNYYQTYLDERGKRLIKIINKGGKRLKNLIVDLIDVSKLESGVISIERKFEDLRKIVEECVNGLYYSFIERELFINVEITGEFLIKVNKSRIEQVIINILSNAIKNTPPRGKITVKLQKHDEYIDIKIQDTGVGFTEEEKEKLYKKFGKIERYGKGMNIVTEGTGLGLFISKELIELHGGKIWVESRGRNEGSTFTIRIPKIN